MRSQAKAEGATSAVTGQHGHRRSVLSADLFCPSNRLKILEDLRVALAATAALHLPSPALAANLGP